jgi:HlyD family secretion protein
VVVDAYPNHQFRGSVEKIEPQAVVQQSVTMFPVLVSLSNEDGMLMPGMNGEVTMLVDSRSNVLAVPVDAVRSVREIQTAATALGLDVNKLRAEVQAQMQNQNAGRDSTVAAMSAGNGPGGPGMVGAAGGGDHQPGGGQRGRGNWAADSTGRGGWRGRGGRDSTGARGNWRASRGGAGGQGFGGGNAGMAGGSGNMGSAGGFGGNRAAGAGGGGFGAARGQARLVFVKTASGFEPRVVRLGLTDYDYAQVIGGVKQGEEVVLLSAAELQSQRQQSMDQIRQRMGGAMSGIQGGGARSGAGGAGGGQTRVRTGG